MRGIVSSRRGVTLTELLVATAVLSIVVAGLVTALGPLQKGLQASKNKTLASNLAQEKMQIVKQQSYFRVLPTTNPSYLADGTPYDASAFPPESITEGSVGFQRYTYVQVITENNGVINVLPPTTPDTGMRQITVTVTWQERSQTRELSINSVMSNPNTVESNSAFTGAVTDAVTGNPIAGALVTVAENVGWRDSTAGNGSYSIRLSPGSFNLAAWVRGYFPGFVYLAVGPNNTVRHDFSLTPMSSGTVSGAAWVNPGVVISQVVVSTPQGNGYDVEYLELFNPTPNAVAVNGGVNLNFVSENNNTQCLNVPLNYVNGTIPSGGYYVIANTPTFAVGGITIAADAYYTDAANASCSPGAFNWSPPSVKDIMHRGHSGTWWLTDSPGNTLDAVGWSLNGATYNPSRCLGSCFFTVAGLQAGWELVRASSPAFYSAAYGRAYKSGDDSVDLTTSTTLQYEPYTSLSPAQTIIAGVPAAGAVISASDGLSSPSTASLSGYPPAAKFALTQVATGTWTVLITSGAYQLENDTVTIAASGSTYVFPSSTTLLNGSATAGFIAGTVLDGFGNPISAPSAIAVAGGGQTATADGGNGRYLLRVSSGNIDVTANSGFVNPDYVAVSSLAVPVALGQVADNVNFILTQGGRLAGWITRDGVNGLQGVTVIATNANGNAQDQEVSDANGNFKTVNIATGAYTLNIPLDTTESSSPTFISATALLGQTVFAGTFTITGALGSISGSVTLSGKPISTGVLIVVATGTITAPPVISSQTLTTSAYYMTSSLENGAYSVSVRQSTAPAYNVYGFYTSMDDAGNVTVTQKSSLSVPVLAGQSVTGKNLAW